MDDKEQEIADLKARLAALEVKPAPEPSATPPKPPEPSQGAQWGCVAVIIVLALVGLAMCTGGGSPSSSSSSSSSTANTYTAAPAWTPPEGYTLYPTSSGSRIGVKWSTARGSECTGYNVTCFAMDVVTEKGCPRSLYAEIKILGKGGDNIGWTNDTAQGVDAGEKVRLVFDTYERGASTAQIAEINCY